jgi:small conductance mechanosensitive channel
VIRAIEQRLMSIPHVLSSPEPQIDVLEFTSSGPRLCVRPFCNNHDYWQVYFDTNRMIRETFMEAGFPVPTPTFALSGGVAGAPSWPGETH